jgi:putative transcriptional regulator
MIHGITELEGASEISPGTGIYIGGIDAAIDGVLDGRYSPLDFRFFIGCHMYKDGDLNFAINSNKYQPIACARSLALKQCIQLPKPLWHEVMEMCGGELREVSRLELMKRDDIQE